MFIIHIKIYIRLYENKRDVFSFDFTNQDYSVLPYIKYMIIIKLLNYKYNYHYITGSAK